MSGMIKVVATSKYGICTTCTCELCAERRLIQKIVHMLTKKRRPTLHDVRSCIGCIYVERERKDGTMGCSKPCVGCSKVIKQFDIPIKFYDTVGNLCVQRSCDLESTLITRADQRRWGRSQC